MDERVAQLEAELKEAVQSALVAKEEVAVGERRWKVATAAWKVRLRTNNAIVKRYCSERDSQLSEITSHLLYFEGLLQHEQLRVAGIIREKDDTIDDLQRMISELVVTNEELNDALNATHTKCLNGSVPRGEEPVKDPSDVSFPERKSKHGAMLTVEPAHGSTRYVSKLAAMKNRLRKHKSNSDLNHSDSTIVEETAESLSQENLASVCKIDKRLFRERCKSIAGYPITELRSLVNGTPITSSPSPEYLTSLKVNEEASCFLHTNRASSHSTLTESPSGLHQEYSWNSGSKKGVKMKSKNTLGSHLSVSSSDISDARSHEHLSSRKSMSALPTHAIQTDATRSSGGDSNPFKSIKSLIKRKGSKLKNKKRSSSLPQSTQAELEEALKLNQEKYKTQTLKTSNSKSKSPTVK